MAAPLDCRHGSHVGKARPRLLGDCRALHLISFTGLHSSTLQGHFIVFPHFKGHLRLLCFMSLMSFFHQNDTCREAQVYSVRAPIWRHITFCPLEGHPLGNFPTFSHMWGHPSQPCITCYLLEGQPLGHCHVWRGTHREHQVETIIRASYRARHHVFSPRRAFIKTCDRMFLL